MDVIKNMTSIRPTSVAQWRTRRNQIIFAVFDVSLTIEQWALTVIKLLRFLH